jgi:3-oxo-5-alpha-steroid 4-dehydrogenase 1
MECPCFFVGGLTFLFFGDVEHRTNYYCLTIFGLYMLHYFNRSFVYPMGLTSGRRSLPTYIAVVGFLNNILSGFIQGLQAKYWIFKQLGAYLGYYSPLYDNSEFFSFHFILGLLLFLSGWAINTHSDAILRNLRRPGEIAYKIPLGGIFNFVTGNPSDIIY